MKLFHILYASIFFLADMAQAQTWEPLGDDDFNQPSYYSATYTSMAIAPDGTPYIGFSDNKNGDKATVKKFSEGLWTNVGSPGFSAAAAIYISLKVAPDGTLYIGYRDAGNSNRATVKKWDGNAWINVGTQGFSAGSVSYTSLAIAPDGTPYLGYSGTGGRASVKKWTGTMWTDVGISAISAGGAYDINLAIMPDGIAYIAYQDAANGSTAAVKKFDGTAWVNVGAVGFSGGSAGFISLAIAPDGTTYIGYDDANGFPYGKATVKKFDGSTWVNVGAPGFSAGEVNYISLAIAPDGTPYLAYDEESVTVKKFNGTAWVNVGIPKFSDYGQKYGKYVSMVFAPDGTPYVGYQNYSVSSSPDKAAVQKFDGIAWHHVAGGGMEGTDGGDQLDLATAPDGSVYLAYRDPVSQLAAVKRWTGTTWDRIGGYPPFAANDIDLAFAPDGTPHAFIEAASGTFTFRYNRITDTWTQLGPGRETYNESVSIAIAPDSTLYVSEAGHTWEYDEDRNIWVKIFTPGGANGIGNYMYNDLAVAADGTLYLAYTIRGDGRSQVSVRKWDGTSWQSVGDPLISDSYAGESSIRIAPDGTLYLCYQDHLTTYGTGKATVKKFDGTAWENVGIPRFTPDEAFNISLAIAPDGTPYVGFGDVIPFNSRYASRKASVMKFNGTAWVDAGNAGLSAGAATETRLTITGDGSRAVIVYNDGNIFAKYLQLTNPLPVRLISFTVRQDVEQHAVILHWKASEENSDYYSLERSDDGRNFVAIANIVSRDSPASFYTYSDVSAPVGVMGNVVYYRLKMVDKDASFSYSSLVSLKIKHPVGLMSVYPVPADQFITIHIGDKQYAYTTASIVDHLGRVLQSVSISADKQLINVSGLPAGTYYVKLIDGAVFRFVKR